MLEFSEQSECLLYCLVTTGTVSEQQKIIYTDTQNGQQLLGQWNSDALYCVLYIPAYGVHYLDVTLTCI